MHEYIGRFAPSPTGPLHFGSLITAVASYCDAKANNGLWLLRMEDLDQPRVVSGAAEHIVNTLSAYGFNWDGEVMYQSQRSTAYNAAFLQLQALGRIYACTCSRKEIVDSARQIGIEGVIYPQTCLHHPNQTSDHQAFRIKTESRIIHFNDLIQGATSQNLAEDIGDFILKRVDGLFAYQLAVVVDDAEQKVTHIVRGADLLNSSTRQIYLQQCLNYPSIQYAHIPVVANPQGEKLSKQTLAKAIDNNNSVQTLWLALDFLQQQPPPHLKSASINAIWSWAIEYWCLHKITGSTKLIHNKKFV